MAKWIRFQSLCLAFHILTKISAKPQCKKSVMFLKGVLNYGDKKKVSERFKNESKTFPNYAILSGTQMSYLDNEYT